MAITRAFRASPQLGPSITAWETNAWYEVPDVDVSPRLGNKELGTDGREYMMVQAAQVIPASGRFDVTDVTFVTAVNASGAWQASPDLRGGSVPIGAYFQARRFVL